MTSFRRRKSRRLILGLMGVSALILAGFMIVVMTKADLYLQPSGVKDKKMAIGDSFRLGGMVETGSYRKDADGLTHLFRVTDCKTTINVSFKGMIPSLFREGQGVIASGSLSSGDTFTATRVLAKHDENYEAKGTKPRAGAAENGVCVHPDNAEKTAY